MKQIIIRVRNREKARLLLEFLRSLDFVELVESSEHGNGTAVAEEAFFAAAGIWEGRDISTDSLRQQAWSRQE